MTTTSSNTSASGESYERIGPSESQSVCVSIQCLPRDLVRPVPLRTKKKADVVEHPEVFSHVGLLVNEPPGHAGLPFI